jgi:hypothetical protein
VAAIREMAISFRYLRQRMATQFELVDRVYDAVRRAGGSATLVGVAQDAWEHHEADLGESGDLFYTWQYDMRWAAQALRDTGRFKPDGVTPKGQWEVA